MRWSERCEEGAASQGLQIPRRCPVCFSVAPSGLHWASSGWGRVQGRPSDGARPAQRGELTLSVAVRCIAAEIQALRPPGHSSRAPLWLPRWTHSHRTPLAMPRQDRNQLRAFESHRVGTRTAVTSPGTHLTQNSTTSHSEPGPKTCALPWRRFALKDPLK